MHRLNTVTALMSLFLAAGCSHHDGRTFLVGRATVESLRVDAISSGGVALTVFGVKPTPCCEVQDPDVRVGPGARVVVTMSSRFDPAARCIDVMQRYEKSFRVTDLEPGPTVIVAQGQNGSDSVTVDVPPPRAQRN